MAYTAAELAALRALAVTKRRAADALAQRVFGECSMSGHAHDDGEPSLDLSENILVEPAVEDIVVIPSDEPGDATAADIAWGKTAWVNGQRITGAHYPPTKVIGTGFMSPWVAMDPQTLETVNGVWRCQGDGTATIMTAVTMNGIYYIPGKWCRFRIMFRYLGEGGTRLGTTLFFGYKAGEGYYPIEDWDIANPVSGEWYTLEYSELVGEDCVGGPQIGIRFSFDSNAHQGAAWLEVKNVSILLDDWSPNDPRLAVVDEREYPELYADYSLFQPVVFLANTEEFPDG